MSMYFDNHVLMEGEEALLSQWSNNEFNMILAISTSAPRIIFISEDGNVVPNFEIVRNKMPIQTIKWHPLIQALAIGWQDGTITLWNEDERLTRDDKQIHSSSITNITFSSDGSRMVTGDIKGTCAVWRTHRGMTPVCQYSREGAISQIVFCTLVLNSAAPNTTDNTNSLFFFGGQSGSVCLADDLKNCSEVCKVPGSVKNILFYEKENSVIIITSHLLLVQFKLNLAEKLVPDRKVKLAVAGNPDFLNTIWAGVGLMATCSGENMIRMFSIASDENYVLTLAEPAFQGHIFQDKINCIAYNPKSRILAGGTKNGYIVMWKCKQMTIASPDSSDGWEARTPLKCQGTGIISVNWGSNSNVLSSLYPNGSTVLTHTTLKKKMKDNFKMIQVSNKAVEVRIKHENTNNSDYQIMITLGMNIKGIDCCGSHTLFWNGKFMQIYDVNVQAGAQIQGSFESKSSVCALTPDSVVQATEQNQLQVLSYSGEVKQVLPLTELEGEITKIEARGKFMVVITSNSMIKIFDISRRTYKQLGVTRKFEIKNGETIGEIKDISLNADGKKLAILCDQVPFPSIRIPDPKFYVYDIDMDKFLECKVSTNKIPVEAFWDQQDPRLLAIETEYAMTEDNIGGLEIGIIGSPQKGLNELTVEEINNDFGNFKKEDIFTGKTLETYFVTTDYGIKKQDSVKFESGDETLLGIQVPFFYYMGRKNQEKNDEEEEEIKNQDEDSQNLLITRKSMKDFIGLEHVDESIRKAIMNFSHNLTVGNMDEAYNSVRNIKNQTVWQNMAQMCVKTKRIDVAMVCLGNMRFARGAKATRETDNEKELDARCAMVAIQLNMIEDAKELYKSCGRYDLLCKLYQSCGEWDEAIAIATKYNRINLKNTHFQYAKHLETIGNIDMAIKHYIESGTHRTEVPRMLTMLDLHERLLEFVNSQRDPALYKWWAQYLEGQGMIQEALQMYREAQDFGACVRMFCTVGDIQAATKIALSKNDPQACFTIARFFEGEGNIADAIQYYSKSGRLTHAIRLAKDNNFDQQVMTMSLMSSKQIMIQSAQYFEQKGKYDKCVQLYSRGGNKRKAMDLALSHNLGHLIEDVASGVGDGDDPEVLQSSVQFLMQNQQYEKAIEIMIGLNQLSEAFEIAEQHNVQLKEEMVMKLVPASTENPHQKKERTILLLRIAKLQKKQGQFKLGAKIYTMANEKMKGMKCLLKSADVKAVISFATNARDTNVFVLAGNFLQNQNWHNDPEIMKTIISFYSKAKAFESLANFYDACAQVEIDEYRDYEKALGAMKEAKRQLDKSGGVNKDIKQSQLNKRIKYLEMFCEAREAITQGNGEAMLQICDQLIVAPGVEEAIRLGDVFAQLIEHTFYKQQNIQSAFGYLEKMKKKGIIVSPYLDSAMVEKIYKGMGMQVPNDRKASKQYADGIDEDIPEDF